MQKIAPVSPWHCVTQLFDCWVLQAAMLLPWHCSWQVAFAVAVHEPLQSASHFVVQLAVVGTDTHCVVQVSLQHALQDAWQSVDEVADTDPSASDVEDEEVQDALHPDWQRVVQSVVQSKLGGLVAHDVEQLDWQVEVHMVSAAAVHLLLHCCSSCAAQAVSQLAGAHWVVQSFWMTSVHCAFASTSRSPHAGMSFASAVRGTATSAAKAMAGGA